MTINTLQPHQEVNYLNFLRRHPSSFVRELRAQNLRWQTVLCICENWHLLVKDGSIINEITTLDNAQIGGLIEPCLRQLRVLSPEQIALNRQEVLFFLLEYIMNENMPEEHADPTDFTVLPSISKLALDFTDKYMQKCSELEVQRANIFLTLISKYNLHALILDIDVDRLMTFAGGDERVLWHSIKDLLEYDRFIEGSDFAHVFIVIKTLALFLSVLPKISYSWKMSQDDEKEFLQRIMSVQLEEKTVTRNISTIFQQENIQSIFVLTIGFIVMILAFVIKFFFFR